jgi:hypothetical protein
MPRAGLRCAVLCCVLQGVRFETVAVDCSPDFVEMYDAAVDVWQDTRLFLADNNMDKGRGGTVRT